MGDASKNKEIPDRVDSEGKYERWKLRIMATGVTKYLYIVITHMKYKGPKVTGAKNRPVSSNPRHKVSFSGQGDRD